MSKYYGESERLLGQIFSLANELPNGAIIFLDEIDSVAASRDSNMHEATRRILSVLLRQVGYGHLTMPCITMEMLCLLDMQAWHRITVMASLCGSGISYIPDSFMLRQSTIDGFEQEQSVVLIAATNRKQDLDPALISRFDTMIPFSLPDKRNREEIAAQHAMHLKRSELAQLAEVTEGMSGRDIKDICQQAERYWASKLIRSHAASGTGSLQLPPIEEYIKSAEVRQKTLLEVSDGRHISDGRNTTPGSESAQGRGLLVAAV
ncbi:hypothetical protein Taro_043757 [Colocasia esculenta]|uniref:ATPase AAA-type core domain-containing protein n=1 Tax=Colocasia esculenta TaxID=4460 RepID=A0A843WLX2_COLES|nr:hypothetical protein [Colocasia esculenta]